MKIVPKLSLNELRQAYAQWRQTRQPRAVPSELRWNTLALLEQHRTAEVLQVLGINRVVPAATLDIEPVMA